MGICTCHVRAAQKMRPGFAVPAADILQNIKRTESLLPLPGGFRSFLLCHPHGGQFSREISRSAPCFLLPNRCRSKKDQPGGEAKVPQPNDREGGDAGAAREGQKRVAIAIQDGLGIGDILCRVAFRKVHGKVCCILRGHRRSAGIPSHARRRGSRTASCFCQRDSSDSGASL